ncbi:hypothetical protein EV121DRAFT_297235 [Schizophyllum commune]
MISELPEELEELTMFGRLVIVGNQVLRLPDGRARLRSLRVLDRRSSQIPNSMVVCNLLRLETLSADPNANRLGVCRSRSSLDLSHAGPALLDEHLVAELTSLCLKVLAVKLSHCGSLAPSNLIKDRKAPVASSSAGCCMPPLAWLQQKLYAGENQLTYDTLSSIACLRELQVLNLSCNDIQDMPSSFFRDEELAIVKSLMTPIVGSNLLKDNHNNWEFDRNWNFNQNMKYLNLSENKKLQLGLDTRVSPAGFTNLHQLRYPGPMDVTIALVGGAVARIPLTRTTAIVCER